MISKGLFLFVNISGLVLAYMVGFNSGYNADRVFMEKHEAEAIERSLKSCQNSNR